MTVQLTHFTLERLKRQALNYHRELELFLIHDDDTRLQGELQSKLILSDSDELASSLQSLLVDNRGKGEEEEEEKEKEEKEREVKAEKELTSFYIGGLDMSYPTHEANSLQSSSEWAIATLVIFDVRTTTASYNLYMHACVGQGGTCIE